MGLLQDLEKSWGTLLSLMAWHWTCLMAIRSYSRQTWEWEFSQRLGPHLKGVLTRTCTGSLLTCWPCAWEPDLLLYIYQNFWSPLGTAILCQWIHVLLIALSVLYCQLPALPADTLLRPAVERVASCPHLPLGSPRDQSSSLLLLFHYCPSDRPFQYWKLLQLTFIFVHFYLGSSSCQLLTALLK